MSRNYLQSDYNLNGPSKMPEPESITSGFSCLFRSTLYQTLSTELAWQNSSEASHQKYLQIIKVTEALVNDYVLGIVDSIIDEANEFSSPTDGLNQALRLSIEDDPSTQIDNHNRQLIGVGIGGANQRRTAEISSTLHRTMDQRTRGDRKQSLSDSEIRDYCNNLLNVYGKTLTNIESQIKTAQESVRPLFTYIYLDRLADISVSNKFFVAAARTGIPPTLKIDKHRTWHFLANTGQNIFAASDDVAVSKSLQLSLKRNLQILNSPEPDSEPFFLGCIGTSLDQAKKYPQHMHK